MHKQDNITTHNGLSGVHPGTRVEVIDVVGTGRARNWLLVQMTTSWNPTARPTPRLRSSWWEEHSRRRQSRGELQWSRRTSCLYRLLKNILRATSAWVEVVSGGPAVNHLWFAKIEIYHEVRDALVCGSVAIFRLRFKAVHRIRS